MRYTPDKITKLGHNEVMVFGANEAGKHGKGAALYAMKHFGAVYGQGMGIQGQTYGIPTKDWHVKTLPLWAIEAYVTLFLKYAASYPETTFYVTPIGTGLAGYEPSDIAPMFKGHTANVILPKSFHDNL